MSIFEVTPDDIARLNDTDLRTLIGRLCELEVIAHGHSAAGVTYGGDQNAGDGGIDVRVDLGSGAIDGFIPALQTGFQVKAEDMPRAKILDEMKPAGTLRPSIVELGRRNGAYIIVSSEGTTADKWLNERRNAMGEAVAGEADAAKLSLEFYDRTRIATWVNRHAGLIPWVKQRIGQALAGWQSFNDWSSSPSETSAEYILDKGVRLLGTKLATSEGIGAVEGINQIRAVLGTAKGVVRLVGLSGVGKTRFVQALFDHRVGDNPLNPHLAVYCDLADQPDPLPLELLTRLQNLKQNCVLIVDNCGVELHRKLAAQARKSGYVRLVTVEYDVSDDEPEATDVYRLEPASSDVIEKILERKHPDLSAPEVRSIAAFSEGNSRVALALADTAGDGVSVANLKDRELFERLFYQKNKEADPRLLRAAKAFSLVYSFDGETLEGDEAELTHLAKFAGQEPGELHAHAAELGRRQLIQKRAKWRAFLPHALAHRLAKQALQDLPENAVHEAVRHFPARLLKSFSRRLGCLHDSPEAQKIVANWLADGGFLSDTVNLSPLGLVVFDNITPVNPKAVLQALEAAADDLRRDGDWSDKLSKITSILRSLAYDADTFERSAALIAKLARTGEETNNTGDPFNVFKSLFHIYLSGTHATIDQRIAVLRALFETGRAEDLNLALAGLDALLECDHFSSSYGFEFGARRRDYGYHPEKRADIAQWYKTALAFCKELDALPSARAKVRTLMASNFPSLARRTGLISELIEVADAFISDGGWPEAWAGVRRALKHFPKEGFEDEVKQLNALAEKLKPSSLAARIDSYLGPNDWGALDIADIDFDDDERYKKAQIAIDAACADIGRELISDDENLTRFLPVLFAAKSHRVWTVGRTIGQESSTPEAHWASIEPAFLQAMKDGKQTGLAGAFFCGLSDSNPALANTMLDRVLDNEALHPFYLHMQSSVGIDEASFPRLIKAVQTASVPTQSFGHLQYGRALDELDGARLREFLSELLKRSDGQLVALDILYMQIYARKQDKKALTADEKAIGRDILVSFKFEQNRQNENHKIGDIARSCLVPAGDEPAARAICENILEGTTSGRLYSWDCHELIAALASAFPRAVLDILVEKNRSELGGRLRMFNELREQRSRPLDDVPEGMIMEWARENDESRFPMLAEVIRPWVRPDGTGSEDEGGEVEWTPIALRLLNEAPDRIKVAGIFARRMRPTAWSGSRAEIMSSRLPLLEALKAHENEAIAKWAAKASQWLAASVAKEREYESKDRRDRDERFEW